MPLILINKKNTDTLPYIQRANAKGIKTWMRVGSGHNTDLQAKDFSELTADPPQRSKLVRVIRDTLEKYEMDGVYIYWKYPGCPVAFLYILFIYSCFYCRNF